MKNRLPHNLKALRKGKSQKEAADLIGVNQVKWSRMERGKFEPDIDLILTLCVKYGVTPTWLLTGVGEPQGGCAACREKDAIIEAMETTVGEKGDALAKAKDELIRAKDEAIKAKDELIRAQAESLIKKADVPASQASHQNTCATLR